VERAKKLKKARRSAFISGNDVAEISVAAGAAMSPRVVARDLSIDIADPEYHLSPEATVDPSRDVLKQKSHGGALSSESSGAGPRERREAARGGIGIAGVPTWRGAP